MSIRKYKNMEETGTQIQNRFERLINNLNVGVYRCQIDGTIIEVNNTAVKMFDADSKDAIRRHNIIDFYKDKNKLREIKNKIMKYGFLKNEEIEVLTLKGRQLWVCLSAVIDKDGEGSIYFDGILVDIAEKKNLEEQLIHSQKMEAIGQLAGGIAHDFNNILTAIIGYGNLLLKKRSGDELTVNYVSNILDLSQNAANLTRNLLAFSRKQILTLQPVDLNEIVKKVEKILVRVIGEHIELKTNLAEDRLIVKIDQIQIEQVLLNLATNARDAMSDGGVLTINTGKEFINTYAYGESERYALLTVADTGTGIDKETQKKIFEPFFTTKEVGKGTGLGLAIVYGIIKQHNGSIDVYSEPCSGTVFKIHLPMLEEERCCAEKDKSLDAHILKNGTETILIAEDEAEVRKIIKTVLEEAGYKVIEARDGEDAICKFIENKDKIQFVILDVIMPKKSGRDVYKQIIKIRPDIKVLFVSGYSGDMINIKDISCEGLNFVSKPMTPSEFLLKIKEVLNTRIDIAPPQPLCLRKTYP